MMPNMADRESVEQALKDAESHVARMPSTPGTRELRARLDAYRRSMETWRHREPTTEQLEALDVGLAEITRIARTTSPTIKMRRPT
jgi:hypothetical protein